MTSSINDIEWHRNGAGDIDRNSSNNVLKVKDLLNGTGAGFCLAKFTQVTLHLGTGLVHSCHHPSPHKIPIEEVEKDYNALFNTTKLKQFRSEMKAGAKPAECDYCWRVEDDNGLSDRFLKSLEPWALAEHDAIVNADPESIFYPTYLEVDFSNVCNFKCIYCGPEYSTRWADELRRKGPLKVLENTTSEQWIQGYQPNLDTLTYKHKEYNPYVDAFWKWFPEAYKKLKVYRITGGEPLLSKETYKSIQWFIDNPNRDIEFNINTNLGVPEELWNEFITKITYLVKNQCVKKFTVYTSLDAWGERAEYLRPGLDLELFKKRYIQLLEIGNIRVTTMCTFNILSITSILELLKWHLELKRIYNPNKTSAKWEKDTGYHFLETGESFINRDEKNPDHLNVVGLDIPYLRHPTVLDAHYAPRELIQKYLIPAMNFMAENQSGTIWGDFQGFEPYEVEKLKRICLHMLYKEKSDVVTSTNIAVTRAKFFDYINEIDIRNDSDFLEVFPEFRDFYIECKNARDTIIPLKITND
jgi:organic radical activating enzyme